MEEDNPDHAAARSKFCAECGTTLGSQAAFCGECGTKCADVAPAQEPTPTPDEPDRYWEGFARLRANLTPRNSPAAPSAEVIGALETGDTQATIVTDYRQQRPFGQESFESGDQGDQSICHRILASNIFLQARLAVNLGNLAFIGLHFVWFNPDVREQTAEPPSFLKSLKFLALCFWLFHAGLILQVLRIRILQNNRHVFRIVLTAILVPDALLTDIFFSVGGRAGDSEEDSDNNIGTHRLFKYLWLASVLFLYEAVIEMRRRQQHQARVHDVAVSMASG